jgi:hypothetical protein
MRKPTQRKRHLGGECQLQSLVKMSHDAARSVRAGGATFVETIGMA